MPDCTLLRRDLLRLGAATILGSAAGRGRAQQGLAAAAPAVPRPLVDAALAALARHEARIWSRDVIAIADFGAPSSAPRFHLVDILAGTTTTLLVAHGKGSDPDHTGFVQRFSDEVGSNATSDGAYLTGETYTGTHGLSRRLIGLDPSNGHAEERAIVIHSAWYADAALIPRQGRLGRSDGCFVFSERDIAQVLARLGRGRLLYAGKN